MEGHDEEDDDRIVAQRSDTEIDVLWLRFNALHRETRETSSRLAGVIVPDVWDTAICYWKEQEAYPALIVRRREDDRLDIAYIEHNADEEVAVRIAFDTPCCLDILDKNGDATTDCWLTWMLRHDDLPTREQFFERRRDIRAWEIEP